MKHYGDITKLSGYDLPVVDIITGGSPCQDLSVAGKRAGLAGERSGLFMEQIRIVKEMRERDRESGRTAWAIRPRYMVWENVPGAFSSGKPKGADFAAVIEEIIKVADPDADVCVCVPDRGWTKSGCYYAEDGSWSIAWRLHDAQFWGVPQRRKRIALVADFGGLSAPEILFERTGLSGDTEPSGEERQGAADGAESGAGSTVCLQGNGIGRQDSNGCAGRGWRENQSYTLNTIDIPAVLENVKSWHINGCDEIHVSDTAYTVGTNANATGRNTPLVYENHSQDTRYRPLGDICQTVSSTYGMGGNNQPLVVNNVLPFDTTQVTSDKNWSNPHYGDPCHPLAAQAHVPSIASKSVVRRLTPMECERLQGYPDGWTDIGEWVDSKCKRHKDADSPRYKALGNSIALPFWAWLARRICAQYERPMAMASLFDGIGGFPLVFSAAGAIPVWASEIEEFPIAVTKRHFPEEEPHEA